MGDPFDPTSRIGAIINDRQYAQISSYVDIAKQEGATIVCGGDQDAYDGLFFPSTIIADVRPYMPVALQ